MANFLHYLNTIERDQAVTAITQAIEATMLVDKAKETDSEIKHRFGIALGLVEVMRRDLGWSWRRINDNLTSALSSWLTNGDWAPPDRNGWVTSPTSNLILPPSLK